MKLGGQDKIQALFNDSAKDHRICVNNRWLFCYEYKNIIEQ
jgi:hypothetical protein